MNEMPAVGGFCSRCAAAGLAGVVGFTAADRLGRAPRSAAVAAGPATVTQTVTVAPQPQRRRRTLAAGRPAAVPASSRGAPGGRPARHDPAALPPRLPRRVRVGAAVARPRAAPCRLLQGKSVTMEPQVSQRFQGAEHRPATCHRAGPRCPDPNVPDAFAVIADRVGGDGLYTSNAQVVVYKLVGDFDPRRPSATASSTASSCTAWRATDGSHGRVRRHAVAIIEGTYRENSHDAEHLAPPHHRDCGPDQYLVSLAVTTAADQSAVAAADATDAIVNGFKVSARHPCAAPAPAPGRLPARPRGRPSCRLLGQHGRGQPAPGPARQIPPGASYCVAACSSPPCSACAPRSDRGVSACGR